MNDDPIITLITAYSLCTCGDVCTRACTVCASTTWCKGPCVKQLWNEHAASEEGKAAAKRFNDMIETGGLAGEQAAERFGSVDDSTATLIPLPDRYVTILSAPGKPVATVPVNPDGTATFTMPEPERTLHVEVIEGGKQNTPPHIPMFDVTPHMLRSKAIEKWIDLIDEEVGIEPWQAKLLRWVLRGSH